MHFVLFAISTNFKSNSDLCSARKLDFNFEKAWPNDGAMEYNTICIHIYIFFTALPILLILIVNSSGLSIEPWGTPFCNCRNSDLTPSLHPKQTHIQNTGLYPNKRARVYLVDQYGTIPVIHNIKHAA